MWLCSSPGGHSPGHRSSSGLCDVCHAVPSSAKVEWYLGHALLMQRTAAQKGKPTSHVHISSLCSTPPCRIHSRSRASLTANRPHFSGRCMLPTWWGGSVFAGNNLIKNSVVLKSAFNYSLYPPACRPIRNTLPLISDCCSLVPGTRNQYSDHLHTAKAPR